MLYKELTITSPDGLKSRPAALFVQVASKFIARIEAGGIFRSSG